MSSPITLCGSISRLSGLVGRTLHEAGYRALGLPFTYVPFEIADVAGALTGMRALGVRGLGVSQPFKEQVLPYLDELDPVAARIGAVNTIVQTNARLVGHNTDWIGAVRALEERRSLQGARVLLLGAGGAARAIAFGLRDRAARITIANRTGPKGEQLARAVDASVTEWKAALDVSPYDVVINATSLGQADSIPGSSVELPVEGMNAGQVAMDIVYKPMRTSWLVSLEKKGVTAIFGGRMLLHQAAAQFELYTDRSVPLPVLEDALGRATAPVGP
jgi:shikimate dehydrogenase